MFNKLIKLYKDLLDKKINHTVLILIIAFLILCAGFFIQKTDAKILSQSNIATINIEGEEYQIIIQK